MLYNSFCVKIASSKPWWLPKYRHIETTGKKEVRQAEIPDFYAELQHKFNNMCLSWHQTVQTTSALPSRIHQRKLFSIHHQICKWGNWQHVAIPLCVIRIFRPNCQRGIFHLLVVIRWAEFWFRSDYSSPGYIYISGDYHVIFYQTLSPQSLTCNWHLGLKLILGPGILPVLNI